METVSHDGRTTAYRATDFGDGLRICYVHGAGGSHEVWVRQYGDREGPPAAAVDLSGHGDSDDVGEVVGADDRDYDLGAGTVVTLPEPNADVLVDKDAAERL